MAKLTMEDVDRKLEEIRTRTTKRPNIIQSLLERARLPKLPKLPRV